MKTKQKPKGTNLAAALIVVVLIIAVFSLGFYSSNDSISGRVIGVTGMVATGVGSLPTGTQSSGQNYYFYINDNKIVPIAGKNKATVEGILTKAYGVSYNLQNLHDVSQSLYTTVDANKANPMVSYDSSKNTVSVPYTSGATTVTSTYTTDGKVSYESSYTPKQPLPSSGSVQNQKTPTEESIVISGLGTITESMFSAAGYNYQQIKSNPQELAKAINDLGTKNEQGTFSISENNFVYDKKIYINGKQIAAIPEGLSFDMAGVNYDSKTNKLTTSDGKTLEITSTSLIYTDAQGNKEEHTVIKGNEVVTKRDSKNNFLSAEIMMGENKIPIATESMYSLVADSLKNEKDVVSTINGGLKITHEDKSVTEITTQGSITTAFDYNKEGKTTKETYYLSGGGSIEKEGTTITFTDSRGKITSYSGNLETIAEGTYRLGTSNTVVKTDGGVTTVYTFGSADDVKKYQNSKNTQDIAYSSTTYSKDSYTTSTVDSDENHITPDLTYNLKGEKIAETVYNYDKDKNLESKYTYEYEAGTITPTVMYGYKYDAISGEWQKSQEPTAIFDKQKGYVVYTNPLDDKEYIIEGDTVYKNENGEKGEKVGEEFSQIILKYYQKTGFDKEVGKYKTYKFIGGVWNALESAARGGIGKFFSLFMKDEDLEKWQEDVDEFLCSTIIAGGIECWTSEICSLYSETSGDGYVSIETNGLLTMAAHIEGERTKIEYLNETTGEDVVEYIYKVTYKVTNPSNSNEKMDFNVYLYGDQTVALYSGSVKVDEGDSSSRTASSAVVQDSKYYYNKVCIKFDESVRMVNEDITEVCNNINEYGGESVPYEGEAREGSTTAGGTGDYGGVGTEVDF